VVEREIGIIDVQPTNLQQLRDAIMSTWSKVSEECFQHLVQSMPRIIKAVLKAKGSPNFYWQGVPNKVQFATHQATLYQSFQYCFRAPLSDPKRFIPDSH